MSPAPRRRGNRPQRGAARASQRLRSASRSRPVRSREHRLVVLRGVDVERNRSRDRDLDDLAGALVEQPPDPLIAMKVREVAEDLSPESDRMAATVLVETDRKR